MANDNKYNNALLTDGTSNAEQILNSQRGRTYAAHASVKSRTTNSPPGSPNADDAYLIPSTGAGDWAAFTGNIAIWQDGWIYMPPKPGMRFYIEDENQIIDFDLSSSSSAQDGYTLLSIVNEAGTDRIYWDASGGNYAAVQLTVATAILMPPTNMRPGRTYWLQVQQDAIGSRVLKYTTNEFYAPIQRIQPPLTTTALAYDMIQFVMAGDGILKPMEIAVVNDLKPANDT